jgi:predicted nucleic acid-binding protein
MFMLDSNTCIQFLNGRSTHVGRRLMGTKPSNIKLCSIVKAELLYGASRSKDAPVALARLMTFFAPYEFYTARRCRGRGIRPHSRASGRGRHANRTKRSVHRRDCPVPPMDPGYSQHSRILARSRPLDRGLGDAMRGQRPHGASARLRTGVCPLGASAKPSGRRLPSSMAPHASPCPSVKPRLSPFPVS